jgi:hypothetical protein
LGHSPSTPQVSISKIYQDGLCASTPSLAVTASTTFDVQKMIHRFSSPLAPTTQIVPLPLRSTFQSCRWKSLIAASPREVNRNETDFPPRRRKYRTFSKPSKFLSKLTRSKSSVNTYRLPFRIVRAVYCRRTRMETRFRFRLTLFPSKLKPSTSLRVFDHAFHGVGYQ